MLTLNPLHYTINVPDGIETASGVLTQQDPIFEVYYCEYRFFERTIVDKPILPKISGIYINLGSQFECSWPITMKRTTFHSNHFAIVHLPSSYGDQCITNGLFKSLIINVSDELLKLWSSEYTELEGLAESLEQNRPYIASHRPLYLDDLIVKEINSLVQSELKGHISEGNVFTALDLITHQCLDHLKSFSKKMLVNNMDVNSNGLQNSLASEESLTLLRKTEDYLLTHLDAKLNQNFVADAVSTHPKLLTRLFKFHHNRTLMDWLYHQRMTVAQLLLATTPRNISSIAKSVGYSDASHFAKAFKRKFGYEPTLNRNLPFHSDDSSVNP